METRTALSHSVDGICIPVQAGHSRPGVDAFNAMIFCGAVAGAFGWFFEASYLTYLAIPILVGIAGRVYMNRSYPAWRDKPIATDDLKELRSALLNIERHGITVSPLPLPAKDMTNGDLEDWANVANEELQKHYRALLSAEINRGNEYGRL